MIVTRHAAIAAVVAFGLAGPATAQATGITYNCDTPTERWSELVLPAPGATFTIKGEVRLNRAAASDQFAPVSRLMVSEAGAKPGDSPDDFAGFSLLAFPARKLGISTKDPKQVVQFVQWDEARGGTLATQKPVRVSDYGDGALPFTLGFDGKAVSIAIDGKQTVIAVNVRHPAVRIVCSTGEFLYTHLTIEAAG